MATAWPEKLSSTETTTSIIHTKQDCCLIFCGVSTPKCLAFAKVNSESRRPEKAPLEWVFGAKLKHPQFTLWRSVCAVQQSKVKCLTLPQKTCAVLARSSVWHWFSSRILRNLHLSLRIYPSSNLFGSTPVSNSHGNYMNLRSGNMTLTIYRTACRMRVLRTQTRAKTPWMKMNCKTSWI